MKVRRGVVESGKVVLAGDPLPDGTAVVVVAEADPGTFTLAPDEEAELLESIREADQGLTVDAWQFLRDLERKT